MVTQQILSKVINEGNTSILVNNSLDISYFPEYENEYSFIESHLQKYGKVPDGATFLAKFPDFDLLEVGESDSYLVDTIEEEALFARAVPIIEKMADVLMGDAREAVEYLQAELPNLVPRTHQAGIDIISQVDIRHKEWLEMQNPDSNKFIKSSFAELDEHTGGWRRGDELIVLLARSGNGKTFVTTEILRSAWEAGNVVGLIEPEMSASSIGYRFDTLHGHISNTALYRGYGSDAYTNYTERLKQYDTPFWVASPKDLKGDVTVPRIRAWVEAHKIELLAIDGISYLRDSRASKFDDKQSQLTHISEDLMALSQDLGIPVFIISQSNRAGAATDTPKLENIRDSDGIGYNASLVISLRNLYENEQNILVLSIEKSRYGQSEKKLYYNWNIDLGIFEYADDFEPNAPQENEQRPQQRQEQATAAPTRRSRVDSREVF